MNSIFSSNLLRWVIKPLKIMNNEWIKHNHFHRVQLITRHKWRKQITVIKRLNVEPKNNNNNNTQEYSASKDKTKHWWPSTTPSIHTQDYLGAMNTCPSDSKLFGSSDSKSATERGRLSGKSGGQGSGELWVNSSCSSEVQGRRREFTIATLRYHGNTSVSQYGAENRTRL